MPIHEFGGKKPGIHQSVFVAPTASIIGDVTIGEMSSVWPGGSIRGDFGTVTIGKYTNIQDNAVVHVEPGEKVEIRDFVTIGHGAVVHASSIGDNVLVGMKSVLLERSKIRENSVVGAGCVVLENMEIPPKSLVVGVPAKVVKNLDETDQLSRARSSAEWYARLAQEYKKTLR